MSSETERDIQIRRAADAIADELPSCAVCLTVRPGPCPYCYTDAVRYARVALEAVDAVPTERNPQ